MTHVISNHGMLTAGAALSLLASLTLLGGCNKPAQGAAGGPPKQGTPEVAVVTMKPEPVKITTELPARTYAYQVAEVRPQVNGIIQKRLFTEGSDVKAGDVLYQIEPSIYQAAYDTAVAAQNKAEANFAACDLKYQRTKSLLATGAVSREEYDNAAAAYKQAVADVAYSSATIQSARVNLDYTRVKAPIDGRIGKSEASVGALATAHQGVALTTIQQTDPIYVDATQSSANLLRLKRSLADGRLKRDSSELTKVKLLFEDGTSYPLEGSLKFSDVTVDPSTGSFILRMVFPNPNQMLLPGMYVRVVVEEGVNENGILVPQRGVSRDPKGNPIALTVDESGMVAQKVLKLDRAMGDKWLIAEGLKAGDRVIVEGLQMAKPGASAKVVPFVADSATTQAATDEKSVASAK